MGIEFYGFFQARLSGQWRQVGRYDHFEGVVLHWIAPWEDVHGGWNIEPIAPWRGAPKDFSIAGENDKNYSELLLLPKKTYCEISWLMAEEILEALPVIEKWVEVLSDEEWQKKSAKSYWDYTHAYWLTTTPRLIDARKTGVVMRGEPDRFEVEFILDRSEEVRDFTDQVSTLQRKFGSVRYVFYYEADW